MADPKYAGTISLDEINKYSGTVDIAGARPVTPEDEEAAKKGNFGRGWSRSFGEVKPIAQGFLGLLGRSGEEAFGTGGIWSATKDYGLTGYQEGMRKLEPLSKDSDEFTSAWSSAKQGNLGALVDWAAYGLGYVAGQGFQAAGTAAVGAGIGTLAAPGAGTVVGAVGGAAEGVALKSAARKLIETQVQAEAARLAQAQAAKAGIQLSGSQLAAEAASEALVKQATKNVASSIGQTMALGAQSVVQEGGSIYAEAEAQAQREGRTLDGRDLARIWGSTVGAAALETAGDKLGLDALRGKIKVGGAGGTAARIGTGGIVGAAAEGGTEAAQTVLERYGAGQEIGSEEGLNDIINSAALGALGGGSVGGAAGALQRQQRAAVAPTRPANLDPSSPVSQVIGASSVDDAIAAAQQAPNVTDHIVNQDEQRRASMTPLPNPDDPAYQAADKERLLKLQAGVDRNSELVQAAVSQPKLTPQRASADAAVAEQIASDLMTGRGPQLTLPEVEARRGAQSQAQLDEAQAIRAANVEAAGIVPGQALTQEPLPRAEMTKPVGVDWATVVPDDTRAPLKQTERPAVQIADTQSATVFPENAARSQPISVSPITKNAAAGYADLTERSKGEAEMKAKQFTAGRPGQLYEAVPHPGGKVGAWAVREKAAPEPYKYSPEMQGNKKPTPDSELADEVKLYVAGKRKENTPAARAFVQAYDRGDVTDMDVRRAIGTEGKQVNTVDQNVVVAAGMQRDELGKKTAGIKPLPVEPEPKAEWVAFPQESGTLGVPRDEMPQVKSEHRGALVSYLKGKGVAHKAEVVEADTLKPTQAEYSPAKVEKAAGFSGMNRSILVSSDNHVVDGHHQWLAAKRKGEPVNVIRLDAPVRDLVPMVQEFPSATTSRASKGKAEIVVPQEKAQRDPIEPTTDGVVRRNGAVRAADKATATAEDLAGDRPYAQPKPLEPGDRTEPRILSESEKRANREAAEAAGTAAATAPKQEGPARRLPEPEPEPQKTAGRTRVNEDPYVEPRGESPARDAEVGRDFVRVPIAQGKTAAPEGTATGQAKESAAKAGEVVADKAKQAAIREKLKTADNSADLRKALLSKDVQSIAAVLAQSSSPAIARVGELVMARKLTTRIRLEHEATWRSNGVMGYYTPRYDTIAYREAVYGQEHTVAHELMHALVSHAIIEPANKEETRLVEGLQSLFEQAKAKLGRRGWYGLDNPKDGRLRRDLQEYVAEAFSNAEFQAALSGVQVSQRSDESLFSMFVRKIAEFLGLSGGNALTETLALLDQLAANTRNVLVGGLASDQTLTPDGALENSIEAIADDSGRTYTDAQKSMFKNVGRTATAPTYKERLAALRQNLAGKIVQGVFDQFAPLRKLGSREYNLARLSKGTAGATEAFLKHGKLSIRDGVYDADQTGGVVDRLLAPLGKEMGDFLWWVAANRAERLAGEERENLFTPDDIDAGKSLAEGKLDFDYVIQHGVRTGEVTRDRTEAYEDAVQTLAEFNKNVLDISEQSGTVNAEARQNFENLFYLPFFREKDPGADEDGFTGLRAKGGLVRQQVIRQLKGGQNKLHSDLLENMLVNWGAMIDAAAKNRAALATLEAASVTSRAAKEDLDNKVAVLAGVMQAQRAGQATTEAVAKAQRAVADASGLFSAVAADDIAYPASPMDKKTVWYLSNGNQVRMVVNDPATLAAIESLQFSGFSGGAVELLSKAKHLITVGVTANPAFKIRNLIRDSMQAPAVGKLNFNAAQNLADGWAATARDDNGKHSAEYVSMLAGGALIRFNTMVDGSAADRTRQLVKQGVAKDTILDDESAMSWLFDSKIKPAWEAYQEVGNRGEEINRAALYKQLVASGVSHSEAALQARDLMDFSLQGTWGAVRFLSQVVPFFNARLQGLYKLGRGAKEDPRRFATVAGGTALASLALWAIYSDDEDWKKREDWDRDNYWWFKFGGTAYRIPKPFEIGALATVAERSVEWAFDDEMNGKRFRARMIDLLLNQLSMNPIPQGVKPIVDLYANKDSFTGRPIENSALEKLQADYRFNAGTSMISRGASTALNTATRTVLGKEALSPVQIDHLIKGYFGWIGTTATAFSDIVFRFAMNEPSRPEGDWTKFLSLGFAQDLDQQSSRYVTQMYDQVKELEKAQATYRQLLKDGKVDDAREFFGDRKGDLRKAAQLRGVKQAENLLTEQTRRVERDPALSSAEKQMRINEIRKRQDQLAKQATLG